MYIFCGCRAGRPRPSADLPPRSIYGAIIKPRAIACPDPCVTFGGKSHQNRWGHCKSKRLEPPHPRCRLHRAGIGVLLCFCGAMALCEAPCALCRRGNRVNKSLRRNGYDLYQVPQNMCLSLHSPAAEGAKTIRAAEIYTKETGVLK